MIEQLKNAKTTAQRAAVTRKLDRKTTFDIIGAQNRLDLEKTECGRRLILFYDAQKNVYDNANKPGFFR